MTTIVLVGDVGGCATQLAEAVAPYVDDPGAVVVQVGDLVDRGPDSSAAVEYVDARLPGGRWVQLVGNHEGQYQGGARFWPEPLPVVPSRSLFASSSPSRRPCVAACCLLRFFLSWASLVVSFAASRRFRPA